MNINGPTNTNSFFNTQNALNRSTERLSSGKQINSAADNAAGFAISNRLTAEIRGLNQASQNANNGISYLQTAEAGLFSITDGIQRIRELALQASNGILSDQDRGYINKEAQQIRDEIMRTIETSNFNGKKLFGNNASVDLQVGTSRGDTINMNLADFEQIVADLGFNNLDLSTRANASSAIDTMDQFQTEVNSAGAEIGAGINRLEATISNLDNRSVKSAASRSRIVDTDFAKESTNLALNSIKLSAEIAMKSQANQRAGNVLRLLS